jgi:glycosyltransferase involved in cell wall biosynthesis
MKIAYICADPGVPVLGNKGASVHVREFTDALVELGHQVRIFSAAGTADSASNVTANETRATLTVLAPSDQLKRTASIIAAGIARLDAQHDHAHLLSEVTHILADPAFLQAALPLLQDFAPDLIIARHALFSAAGLTLARALDRPCVLEVNAPLVEERRRYWGLTLECEAEDIERAVFAGVDQMVAVSEGVRAYLLQYGAPRERIVVLPNGVNLAHFHPSVDGSAVRRRYALEDKLVIGFSGSLKPWHGVDMLMRAFASINNVLSRRASSGAALHLLIIGNGPQREQLELLAHELGVSAAVTFTGAVPHSDMPTYLAAMDIAVAPYVSSDGFYFSPLKVMEYLAMGRAIVAPMLGQLPSLLQGATGACGLLYPSDDQHELAVALFRVIGDAALRRELGARAAAQARLRSSWQTIAEQIIERTALGEHIDSPLLEAAAL